MITDITIIGGGPTGLFARFYAGMRGVTAQIVDALPQLGGQLTALYPEKYIFDVAGFPKILAKDLVRNLVEQSRQFAGNANSGSGEHLNQNVIGLEQGDGHMVLVTDQQRLQTRAVIIAAGIGAFTARRLPQACAEPWYGRGIFDVVLDPEEHRGKHVVIIGGGDSAFDWAQQLIGRAARVTVAHRSDRYRAHGATISDVQRSVAEGNADLLPFHELHDVLALGDVLTGVILRDTKTRSERTVKADVVLPMLGYKSDLGALQSWGLSIEKNEIQVNSLMETGRAGVYAAGDVTDYPGKLKLIASGFSEAAVAVNQAVHWMYPEKKASPGHSSNMAIFGQSDD
jgi:thioredoxin reductase (NADPH)